MKTTTVSGFLICTLIASSPLHAKPKKKDPLGCASDVFLASCHLNGGYVVCGIQGLPGKPVCCNKKLVPVV